MREKKCNRCIFKNRKGICTLKNIHTEDIDYDCWFFKYIGSEDDEDCQQENEE